MAASARCREPIVPTHLYDSSPFDERLDHITLILESCSLQRRHTFPVRNLWVSSARQELANAGRFTSEDGRHERLRAHCSSSTHLTCTLLLEQCETICVAHGAVWAALALAVDVSTCVCGARGTQCASGERSPGHCKTRRTQRICNSPHVTAQRRVFQVIHGAACAS